MLAKTGRRKSMLDVKGSKALIIIMRSRISYPNMLYLSMVNHIRPVIAVDQVGPVNSKRVACLQKDNRMYT